jgi:predicted transcriptional regulator
VAETPPRLGPLEREVMDLLWDCEAELCTRDVLARTSHVLAYPTVATGLTTLVRQGLAERVPVGRTWAYRPVVDRGEYLAGLMTEALNASADHESPLLHFVGAMSDDDLALLRTLVAGDDAGNDRPGERA